MKSASVLLMHPLVSFCGGEELLTTIQRDTWLTVASYVCTKATIDEAREFVELCLVNQDDYKRMVTARIICKYPQRLKDIIDSLGDEMLAPLLVNAVDVGNPKLTKSISRRDIVTSNSYTKTCMLMPSISAQLQKFPLYDRDMILKVQLVLGVVVGLAQILQRTGSR